MAEFGSLDLEEMTSEDARLSNEGGAGNFLDQFVPMPEVKPGQTGTVAIRALPPVKGGKLFQYNRTHKLNGRSIHCPRPLVSGKWDRSVACPICDYYSSIWKQIEKLEKAGHGAQADKLKEEARAIKPVERYYYNAIVRSMVSEGKELKNVGPRILSVGVILHKMIIRAIVGEDGDPDSKLGNITDLKSGYDFIIRKEVTAGMEGFPKYERSGFARTSSPAGTPEEVQKWQEALHDLTKLRNPRDIETLEKELAIHRGLIPDETETFKTEDFDAKWRQKTGQVAELANYNKVVNVPVDLKAESGVVAETAKVAESAANVAIEDESFLAELAGLGTDV